jgi:UDP-N-acetylmuramoyl-tripeptide--D-alanyl-D-alanine ligase
MSVAPMTRTLASVAEHVHGRLVGEDRAFAAVSTDTRTLTGGALFVAIEGDRFDGHDYVAQAQEKGAAGALVARQVEPSVPQVIADDTRRAFGRMARAWRETFPIPAVAVTGSSGKTTVKTLIGAILGRTRSVCVTEGSLNNDIGVPLTLMRLDSTHEALVAELAANHAGEIDYLASLAQPTVGVLTNAGPAHLEGFGSLEGVAAAKGELLDHLPRAGTAVLNVDDVFYAEWRARAQCEFIIGFGFAASANCTVAGEMDLGPDVSHFRMRLPDGTEIDIQLGLPGRHNVMNALAAAAAAHALGAGADEIRAGLAAAAAVRGRLNILAGRQGARVIDDSYNANPASVRAALDYLAALPGRRVLVLGDMAELGSAAATLHREVGEFADGRCDRLIAVGELAAHAASGFKGHCDVCDSMAGALTALEPLLAEDLTVLIKGSRVMGLEKLAAALCSAPASQAEGGSC